MQQTYYHQVLMMTRYYIRTKPDGRRFEDIYTGSVLRFYLDPAKTF